jgi:hypothetical protein
MGAMTSPSCTCRPTHWAQSKTSGYLRGNTLYDDIVGKNLRDMELLRGRSKAHRLHHHTIMGDGQSLGRLV